MYENFETEKWVKKWVAKWTRKWRKIKQFQSMQNEVNKIIRFQKNKIYKTHDREIRRVPPSNEYATSVISKCSNK